MKNLSIWKVLVFGKMLNVSLNSCLVYVNWVFCVIQVFRISLWYWSGIQWRQYSVGFKMQLCVLNLMRCIIYVHYMENAMWTKIYFGEFPTVSYQFHAWVPSICISVLHCVSAWIWLFSVSFPFHYAYSIYVLFMYRFFFWFSQKFSIRN